MIKNNYLKGFIFSFLSAILYAINVPISKKFINELSSNELLFLLYIGSAIGVFIIILLNKKGNKTFIPSKEERPYISGIILCDVIAAILIVESLRYLNASTVSLLSILEIGATIIISTIIFKTKIYKNLILSVIFVTLGGIVLSIDNTTNISLSLIILLPIIATLLWGLENNLTAKISNKNPLLLVFYKCLSVAIFNMIFILKDTNIIILIYNYWYLLLLGFLSYGLSILYFAYSTNLLGASKTAIIFSLSPIFSTIFSIIIFKDEINIYFIISLLLMLIGIYFSIIDSRKVKK